VQLLRAMALAADSLAVGDTVEQLIRRDSRWELLPLQVGVDFYIFFLLVSLVVFFFCLFVVKHLCL